jgi:predicted HAD superfamily Cof-like phosphohydrolase
MSSDVINDQKVFMVACGQTVSVYNADQFALYKTLIAEETKEFEESVEFENTIKELLDILVVTLGALHSTGIDVNGVWSEVVRSNMSKVDPITNKVIRREDGKILKGINYSPPDFSPYISQEPEIEELDIELLRQVITRIDLVLKKDNNKNEN